MNNLSLFLQSPFNQPYLYVLLIADLILRGLALYKSAQKEQKIWFILLLVINSLGILPLVYLILQKMKAKKLAVRVAPKKKTARRK